MRDRVGATVLGGWMVGTVMGTNLQEVLAFGGPLSLKVHVKVVIEDKQHQIRAQLSLS